MDEVQTAFYRMIFRVAFLGKKGTEFQDWFARLAGHAFGSDFETVRVSNRSPGQTTSAMAWMTTSSYLGPAFPNHQTNAGQRVVAKCGVGGGSSYSRRDGVKPAKLIHQINFTLYNPIPIT